jgi:hypothetical protein
MKKTLKIAFMSLAVAIIAVGTFAFTHKLQQKFTNDYWYLDGQTTLQAQNEPANELVRIQGIKAGNGHTYNLTGGTGFHAYENGFTTQDPINGTLDATVYESN